MPEPRAERAERGADDIISAVLALHEASGEPPVKGRVWQRTLPGGWYLACNGCTEPQSVEPPRGMAVEVKPFEFAFWFNGWLAGSVHPVSGGCVAAGAAANVDTLLTALEEARCEFPTQKGDASRER